MPAEGQRAGPADALSPGPPPGRPPGDWGPGPSLARRGLVAFGRFWWDFLVGDTPELLVGALIILGVVAVLVKAAAVNAAAVAGFPVMVAVLLGVSVYRGRPSVEPGPSDDTGLAGHEAQPDTPIGVVAVGVHQDNALPCTKRRHPGNDWQDKRWRHERREQVVCTVAGAPVTVAVAFVAR